MRREVAVIFTLALTVAGFSRISSDATPATTECNWMEDYKQDITWWPDNHWHVGVYGNEPCSECAPDLIQERTIAVENYHDWWEEGHMGGNHPECM